MVHKFPWVILLLLTPEAPFFAQCIDGNCYSGMGSYVFSSGARYRGEFLKGQLHGKGTCFFTNGDIYDGQWYRNVRQGEGEFRKKDGTVYKGSFRHNQPHGKGILIFPDGSFFKSDWERGESVGKGFLTNTDGQVLQGQWSDGVFTPVPSVSSDKSDSAGSSTQKTFDDDLDRENGTFSFPDGSVYEGEMVAGEPKGKGKCVYQNGDLYIGEWVYNQPHGQGTMYYANDIVVTGIWNHGRITQKQKSVLQYPEKEVSGDVEVFALIVGVARYPDFESLKYTDDDAYQFYAFLKSPEGGAVPDDHIRILIDESATASNIGKSIDEIVARADPNDAIIMYFAGHGLGGFFIPYDCNGYVQKLMYETIKQKLNRSRAKHKLCIVDACYSGSLLANKAPMMESLNLFYHQLSDTQGGTAFLMSSSEEEVSLESGGLRQGIFSHYLIEGLKGRADLNHNKIITIGELHDFVQEGVRDYTKEAQNPVLAGRFDQNMPVGLIR